MCGVHSFFTFWTTLVQTSKFVRILAQILFDNIIITNIIYFEMYGLSAVV